LIVYLLQATTHFRLPFIIMKTFNPLLLALASGFSLILAQATSAASSAAPSATGVSLDQACWDKNKCDDWSKKLSTNCNRQVAALSLDVKNPANVILSNTANIQNLFDCVCNIQPIFDSWAICFGCETNLPSDVEAWIAKMNDSRCKSSASGSSAAPAGASPSASGSGSGGSPAKTSGSGSGGGASPSPTASASGGSGGSNSSSPGSGGGNKTGSASPSSTSSSGAGSIVCSMAILGGIVIAGGMLLV